MSEMTAAERYAQLKENRFEAWLDASFSDESLKGVQLYEVTCPSGLKIKCRQLDEQYLNCAGQTPMALGSLITGQNPEEQFAQMTPIQQAAAIQNASQIVRYVAVEPRIVEEVGDNKNAIAFALLTMEDFNHVTKWATGGEAAEGLKTFRRKRK